MMPHHVAFTAFLLVLLLIGLPASVFGDEATKTSEQIDRLIQQLGSPNYAERQQAEAKLSEFHIEAFEALIRAREHQDPEIAARARYLVNQIQVNLVSPTDSPRVAALMRNIFLLDRQKQDTRITELAIIPNGEGLSALCRLIRFSESETTAKTAAIGIIRSRFYSKEDVLSMGSEPSIQENYGAGFRLNRAYPTIDLFSTRQNILDSSEKFGKPLGQKERDAIRQQLKSCRRPAAKLVLAWFDFAEAKTDAEKKKAYDQWDKLCRQEEQQMKNHAATVTPSILSLLLKLQMAKAVELNLGEVTQVELMRRQLQRNYFWGQGNYEKIVNRLIDEKTWKLADLSIPEFGTMMTRAYHPDVLTRFCCLLTKKHKNNPEKSKLGDELFELYEKSFQTHGTARADFSYRCAVVFIEEGLFDRAISQFKKTAEIEDLKIVRDPERLYCWKCFLAIIDIYDGLERFELAAKTCDEMRKKQESLSDKQKERLKITSAMKRSQSQSVYYRAMAEKKKGNNAAYRKLLEEAFNLDPESDQILIECYSLPVTPENRDFHDRIVEQIRVTVAKFTKLSKNGMGLENYANRTAWLVAKTEGDLDAAIQLLEPVAFRFPNRNAAMLDTLALCYFRKGDLEKAVSLQRKAVGQNPHDSRIQAAWKMISAAYEKKTGKKPEPPQTGTVRFRKMMGLPEKNGKDSVR